MGCLDCGLPRSTHYTHPVLEAPLSTIGVCANLPAPTWLYVLAFPGTEMRMVFQHYVYNPHYAQFRLNFGLFWYCINNQRNRGCVSLDTSLGILPWKFGITLLAWVRSKHHGVLTARGVGVCGSKPQDPYSYLYFRSGRCRSV